MVKQWSRNHSCCTNCGTTERRHLGKGLCSLCYNRQIEEKHRKHIEKGANFRVHRNLNLKLNKEYLLKSYVAERKSLTDIARENGCTRQYVHKRLKELGIQRRDLEEARNAALEQHKLPDKQRVTVNKKFFAAWSDEMAYVLGLVFTDGNIQTRNLKAWNSEKEAPRGRMTISQKEPELLVKVRELMGCNAKLTYQPQRGIAGELYTLQITNSEILADLLRLGVTPNKSRDMQCPTVPSGYLRHFIRGCWDGDGHISEKKASFVSGTLTFVEAMKEALENAGIRCSPIGKMRYTTSKGKSEASVLYMFGLKNLAKMYHWLYDGVEEIQYLKRKHDIFASI